MNDGKINLPSSAFPRVAVTDHATAIKILSAPPNMPNNGMIEGKVVSNEKNVITLQTEYGIVSLDAKQQSLLNVKAGDMLQLRVNNTVQNVQNALVTEIISALDTAPKENTVQQPLKPTDTVVLPKQNAFEEYASLQAKLVGLPNITEADALSIVIKSLLKLPLQEGLPPSLSEGFEKFQQLNRLLMQVTFLPEQGLQPIKTPQEMPQGLLTALQNLVQNVRQESNPLNTQPPFNLIQLQTIFPGENLSPNILVDIRQQLVAILQKFNPEILSLAINPNDDAPTVPAQPAQQGTTTPPPNANAPAPTASVNNAFTMPAIGMVIGMPVAQNQAVKGDNLVVLTMPDGQNLIGFLSAQIAGKAAQTDVKTLLPGTVFVIAFQPQADKMLTIPMIPVQLLADGMNTIQPLHLTLGDTWPALEELWQASLTQQFANPEALSVMRQTVPMPHIQQFPPALLFFMAVIKNGLFNQWIGDDAFNGLNKTEALQQLAQDMRAMQSRMADDGNSDTWKPLPVPIQVGDQLMRLQFFYRHPEDSFANSSDDQVIKEKHQKTRFVLNIPHTYLGDLQIDGLVQFKDLEMILRTEKALPSQTEQDIRVRYQNVLEISGMHGNINFQSGREHYIRV